MARDVALSGGDGWSEETRDLLRKRSRGARLTTLMRRTAFSYQVKPCLSCLCGRLGQATSKPFMIHPSKVRRLNAHLSELSSALDAKDAFIFDAAHQFRNPFAGIHRLAKTVAPAKTNEDVKERTNDLLNAVREAAHLANSLLTLQKSRRRAACAHCDSVRRLDDLR